MIKLCIKPHLVDIRYPEDCDRLIAYFKTKGYSLSRESADYLWHNWGEDTYFGSWLNMTDDGLEACFIDKENYLQPCCPATRGIK